MSWTINENTRVSSTQYFNASYSTTLVAADSASADSEPQNVAGYTSGTISFTISPSPSGLSTVGDALLLSITQQTIGATPGTYIGIVSTSSGAGIGVIFSIRVGGVGTVINLTVTTSGSGYAVGDTVTIARGDIGGGFQDLIITLQADDFAWTTSSTLEMIILGRLDTTLNPFFVQSKIINAGDLNSTFYVDWNIPLKTVALRVNNTTGVEITISSIRMQTESEGGGLGNVSTSGTTIGPGGSNTQIQFNDGGIFGGASGALYDKTNTGQIQLAAGTTALPMLAFSDAAGNYDTGIYRNVADMVAFSTGGVQKVTCSNSDTTPFINGLNVGVQANIAGIRRLSTTDTNSWEDGHLGNSNYLYFSPRDFVGDTSPRFQYSANAVTGPEFIYTTTNGTTLLGIKLMPKGFRVKAEEGAECQLYSRNNNGFGLDVTVNLDEQSISPLPSFNSLMAGIVVSSPGSWDGAGATNNLVVSQGTVSDGTLQICFMLYDIATTIPVGSGLIGARVPIERV